MDIRGAINDYVYKGRDLTKRIESDESHEATDIDLHMLKVQLYLLESATTKLQVKRIRQPKTPQT